MRRTHRGASVIEFVVVMGLVLTVFLMVLQLALRSYAEHVAQAAAEAGLAVTRAHDGSVAAGRAQTLRRAAQISTSGLTHVDVDVSRGADTATVTVVGRAQQILPGLDIDVERTVSGPVERFAVGPVTP